MKAFRELRTAAGRRREGAFLLEGPHLFEQLLSDLDRGRRTAYRPRFFLLSEPYIERFGELGLARVCERLGLEGGRVSARTMEQLSDTGSPQGVLAAVAMPDEARNLAGAALALSRRPRCRMVLTSEVADPGNLGTLVRSAAAFGVDLFLVHGGADPFGPKVLRATAGAFLAVRYGEVQEPERLLKSLAEGGVKVVAAVPRGGGAPEALRVPGRWILLCGSEAHGLPKPWVRHADLRVSIPVRADVESLNVAVAGSILLYALGERKDRHRPPARS